MIAHISGRLIQKGTESVVIDVNGVGYELFIPLSTFYTLPGLGEQASLKVYTNVREDAIQLYGFLTQDERDVFGLLIGVSGVGPKLARNILSGIAVADLVSAIGSADSKKLSSIPGIGGKSAERLILELRDKIKNIALKGVPEQQAAATGEGDPLANDVVSALENLGYKTAQAEEAVKKAKAVSVDAVSFEAFLKEALKHLSKR
ncbi:MAG: Holliday junction branch migration protein RuvA [Deltaproteobacteria bacterium]|nr:Holliday junction branch migration protein RuvA [Deltaproteobacteria bacterium]